MNVYDQILAEAKEVRELCEKLVRLGKVQYSSELSGMCAVASYQLFCRLKKLGLKPKLAQARNHAFVICEDYLVDITATQFHWIGEFNPIEIRPYKDIQENPPMRYWQIKDQAETITEIVRSFSGWMCTGEHPLEESEYIKKSCQDDQNLASQIYTTIPE